jgi:hypothetical protein
MPPPHWPFSQWKGPLWQGKSSLPELPEEWAAGTLIDLVKRVVPHEGHFACSWAFPWPRINSSNSELQLLQVYS